MDRCRGAAQESIRASQGVHTRNRTVRSDLHGGWDQSMDSDSLGRQIPPDEDAGIVDIAKFGGVDIGGQVN